MQEGEFVIIKDDSNAKTWYCAEIRRILADRIKVNYYTTVAHAGDSKLPGLVSYVKGRTLRRNQLFKNMVFRQRQRLANHDPTTHESWKDETPLVGKNTA